MKPFSKNKLFLSGLFLYASEFFINYLIRITPSLHFAKDGGIVDAALFHCISSYLFFILLQRNFFTFFGLGLFIGFASCIIDMFLMNYISWNPSDYFNFILLNQIIAATFVLIAGTCLILISNSLRNE